jgi:hypothetical protein
MEGPESRAWSVDGEGDRRSVASAPRATETVASERVSAPPLCVSDGGARVRAALAPVGALGPCWAARRPLAPAAAGVAGVGDGIVATAAADLAGAAEGDDGSAAAGGGDGAAADEGAVP